MRQIEVNRRDYRDLTSVEVESPPTLEAGQVRLRIDAFSLTANNVTYAVAGDMIGYWRFFPASQAGYGMVPVWGFAEVAETTLDNVPLGRRVYGYFPMAEELIVAPLKVSERGFTDGTAHRRPLPLIYNHYMATAADPLYKADVEAMVMLIRPLFTTSYLIDDFCAEQDFWRAEQMLITAASSKTGFALAEVARHRAERPVLIGLTSARNRDFVDGLGFYDRVLCYDELDSLNATKRSFYVDMAGSHGLRERLHQHFGDALVYALAVGAAHWDQMAAPGVAKTLPGPTPEMFFAPSQAEKRLNELGAAVFSEQIARAWHRFLPLMSDRLSIREVSGPEAIAAAFQALVDGRADPKIGIIASV